jgi:hypothetical protein
LQTHVAYTCCIHMSHTHVANKCCIHMLQTHVAYTCCKHILHTHVAYTRRECRKATTTTNFTCHTSRVTCSCRSCSPTAAAPPAPQPPHEQSTAAPDGCAGFATPSGSYISLLLLCASARRMWAAPAWLRSLASLYFWKQRPSRRIAAMLMNTKSTMPP